MTTVDLCRNGLKSILNLLSDNQNLFAGIKSTYSHLPDRKTHDELLIAWNRIDDYYTVLDVISSRHKDFLKPESKRAQGESFHVFRAATYAGYRFALDFIAVVEENPTLDTILNDPSPEHGLVGGTYMKFKTKYLNFQQATAFAALETLAGYYGPVKKEAAVEIEKDRKRIWEAGFGEGPVLTVQNGIDIVQKSLQTMLFPFQKGISNWMGETKVYRPEDYLITPDVIKPFKNRLEPGDILLERREWYMTNVGIPGYWTHAALYVGTPEERKKFFCDAKTDDWIRHKGAGNFEELLQSTWPDTYKQCLIPTTEGHLPAIIEAIAQGVTFTSFEHSTTCDALAVLRPGLTKAEKARAVFLAFGFTGRPYDYDFNFATDSSMVCSEVIYKAYAPDADYRGICFPIETMMGRILTPPNAFAKMFHDEFEKPGQQLDLVFFLDGYEKDKKAVEDDIPSFLNSWKRPKWHILLQPSLKKE